MNQRLQIVCLALVVLQPGCATETRDKPCPGCMDASVQDALPADAGAADCQPGFDFQKLTFGCNGLCPPGQVCEDTKLCVPMGCSKAPECATKPEPYRFFHSPINGLYTEKVRTISGTIKMSSPTGPGFSVMGATETFPVLVNLPAEMALPITAGMAVTLKLCYNGSPKDGWYNVVLRDAQGGLIAAGGWGISASLTGCLVPDMIVTRKDLDCAPFPSGKDYDSFRLHANFALTFTADTTLTLPQRGRGSLTIKGAKFKVGNFMSYHHIEWQGTGMWGPVESYALVKE